MVNSLALQGQGLGPGPICADFRLKGEDFLCLVLKQMLQSLKVLWASSAVPGRQSCWTRRPPPARLQMPEERCCVLLRPQRHRQVLPPESMIASGRLTRVGQREKKLQHLESSESLLCLCALHFMELCFPTLDTFSYFYSAKYNLIKFTLNSFTHTPNADKWLVAGYRTGHSK